MTTNSDLTPVQSAGSTGNPQNVDGNVGASDSGSFQQSAGVDSLSESRPISVAQTGQTVKGSSIHGSSLVLMWVFIIVASIVLIMIASSVFKWVMKRPDEPKEKAEKTDKSESTPKPQAAEPNAPKVEIVRPQSKGKKKTTRSGRKKK